MSSRPLPYPLGNSASLSAITDGDASFNALPVFPEDMDEKTFVMLHISANEFKKIASSIDIGSDIGYPEDSVGVWYAWVRSVMSDSPCEIISDCIENNEGTRNSIVNLVTSPSTVEKIIERAKELGLIPVEPTVPYTNCNDNLYGACVQYVAQINQSLSDFFEVSETFRGEQILEVVAGLDLDIGAVFGFISWMRDQAADGYNASYTDVIADQIACDLFCLMKDECGFTLSVAYDYHISKISDYIDLNPFGDSTALNLLAAYIGFDDISAEVWVNGLMALFVGQLLVFEQAINILAGGRATISQLQKRIQSWMNDPDPDWIIFCTDCAPETKVNVPVYGRGYSIDGGAEIVVNPVSDDFMTIPFVAIGSLVTVFNHAVLAIGNCASSYAITVTVTNITSSSYVTEKYLASTCASDGGWSVDDIVSNRQLNLFGVGNATFRIDA